MKNTTTPQQQVAKRIFVLRKKLRISQHELAKRIGKDKQLIQRLETGRHDPKFSTLNKVAAGLGVTIHFLTKVK